MTLFRHITKNAQRSTFNVQRSSIFDFGVRRSPPTPNSSFLTPHSLARTRAAAFTLVETALALLAISLGLLGIFGLARHGLKNGGDTENETRCTLLADTVFETFKAKNNELTARKVSLYDWWNYWRQFASNENQISLYLPPMQEISENYSAIRISVLSTHVLHELVTSSNPVTEIRWNPVYDLQLSVDFNDIIQFNNVTQLELVPEILLRLACDAGLLDGRQIDVTLTLHPGRFQSGAETRTFYTTLTYTGGLL